MTGVFALREFLGLVSLFLGFGLAGSGAMLIYMTSGRSRLAGGILLAAGVIIILLLILIPLNSQLGAEYVKHIFALFLRDVLAILIGLGISLALFITVLVKT
ncbi:MAG: hypothetical protein DRN14_00305 [Thermoplasmata archaeon]|nr:MAG: hypothetical protein DRN14_00305 [Thermoplasmata archaeon]